MSRVTELVAKELGLTTFEEELPTSSLYGVTNVVIRSDSGAYRVYMVKDANDEKTPLDESSKLSAFYNSQFILRSFLASHNPVPVGQHQISFQIQDDKENHSIYVIKIPNGEKSGDILTVDELYEVADGLAKLHSIPASELSAELRNVVSENYGNLSTFDDQIRPQLLTLLTKCVEKEHASLFSSSQIIKKVQYLTSACQAEPEEREQDNYEKVVCHGRLCGDVCVFHRGELVELLDWDAVHIGDPAEDLANLIVSSSDSDTRQNHLMDIIRAYYYKLVDFRTLNFGLSEFRERFRKNQKKAVINCIEPLLNIMASDAPVEYKKRTAERWEQVLDEVYEFESNSNGVDVEHVFFAKK